jgi:glycosyltransferase involved in cell wall biosynthesis
MKKILHILSQRPAKTGSGIYLLSLLQEADKKRYEQCVIVGIPEKDKEVDLEYIKKFKYYPVCFQSKEIPFPVVGMSDVMPYESTRYKDLTEEMFQKWKKSFGESITKAIKEFKPDLIITHHLWVLSVFVKELAPNIPTIAVCHGTGLRQSKLAYRFSDYVVKGCKNIDSIFALNNYQKEKIIKDYEISEDKVSVIGSGYNSNIFFRGAKSKDKSVKRLVYAGKLSYSKGVLSLLRAYGKLNKYNENIELVLVGSGSGEEFENIKREAEGVNLRVIFKGAVPQKDLGEIFRESDIFILPSLYEGLPLVLIEALASGLRVVSTDLPGVKHWIGDDINNSGVIKYVKLPRLIDTDIPLKEDLPQFEEELGKAIERQIELSINCGYIEDIKIIKAIEEMSWAGVLNKMEKHFK